MDWELNSFHQHGFEGDACEYGQTVYRNDERDSQGRNDSGHVHLLGKGK